MMASAVALMCVHAGVASANEALLTLRNARIPGAHGEISFNRAALEALPQYKITTGTDFTTGVATFLGPLALDVIDMIGRSGSTRVRLVAANAFSVELEIDELKHYGAILALYMDGRTLTRRDKGPIWLMYPMDAYPELDDPEYNNRLIWQVEVIELL